MFQNSRLVDLEEACAGRPAEAEGTRVQAGGHQHYLPDAVLQGDAPHEVVEEAGAQEDGDGAVRRPLLDPRHPFRAGQGGRPGVIEQAILTGALLRAHRRRPAGGRSQGRIGGGFGHLCLLPRAGR